MDTSTFTQYSISGNIGTAYAQDEFSITLTLSSGVTDASVMALASAIKDVDWPSGVSCMIGVFRSVQTTVTSAAHLAAEPPVFT